LRTTLLVGYRAGRDDAISRVKARYASLPDYETSFSEYPSAFTVQVINRQNADDSFVMSVYSYEDRRVSTIIFGVHKIRRRGLSPLGDRGMRPLSFRY